MRPLTAEEEEWLEQWQKDNPKAAKQMMESPATADIVLLPGDPLYEHFRKQDT